MSAAYLEMHKSIREFGEWIDEEMDRYVIKQI